MGRASRKGTGGDLRGHWTETHPDRELWSPGRLAQARTQTEEEYEALYGRGAAVEPTSRRRSVASPLFPNLPIALGQLLADSEPLSIPKRIEILSYLHLSGQGHQALSGDPVMEALWQKEMDLLQGDLQGLRSSVSDEDLRYAWDNYLLPHVAHSQQLSHLAEGPLTLLQASFQGGFVTPDSLVTLLDSSSNANQIIAEQILPAARLFMGGQRFNPDLDDRVFSALRHFVREGVPEYDQECAVWDHHHSIVRALEQGGSTKTSEFEQAPLHNSLTGSDPDDRPMLMREFWLDFCDRARPIDVVELDPLTGTDRSHRMIAAEAAEAARSLSARQVLRLLAGVRKGTYSLEDLDADHLESDRAWDGYADGHRHCPLENLRPLFRGLQAEDELDSLIGDVDDTGVRDDLGEYIRNDIYEALPAPVDPPQVWAESIANTIRGAL